MEESKKNIMVNVLMGFLIILAGLAGYLGYKVIDLENNSDTLVTENSSQVDNLLDTSLISDLSTVDPSDHLQLNEYMDTLPTEELSQDEIDGLLLMREEEKLAHDIYTTLYEKWGQNIFNNIAKSEQTHTDSVADLLEKYDIEDPVTTNAVGVFESDVMSDLYTQLTDLGSKSIVDALTVGATVEDLDIKDLQDLMASTDNADILTVYNNLEKGSRNHIRSFTRMLNRNGATYEAQYISESEYNEIIGTPSENGVTYDQNGAELSD